MGMGCSMYNKRTRCLFLSSLYAITVKSRGRPRCGYYNNVIMYFGEMSRSGTNDIVFIFKYSEWFFFHGRAYYHFVRVEQKGSAKKTYAATFWVANFVRLDII